MAREQNDLEKMMEGLRLLHDLLAQLVPVVVQTTKEVQEIRLLVDEIRRKLGP